VSDKAPREKVQVEPVPKNKDFFEWFEKLFDGASHFPEKIDVRIVSGRYNERLGPTIKQIPFAPIPKVSKRAKEEEGETVASGTGRPTREQLVNLTNEILFLIQRDCDQSRRATVYSVMASHFSRDPEPYERWIFRLTPQGVHGGKDPRDEDGDEDEDDEYGGSPSKKYAVQKLRHDETMFQLYGGALEGLVDRQDRALEREAATNERLRQSNERLLDMVEKLQSAQHQRALDHQWNELKIRSVEKGLDLFVGLAPPLLNQLTGKQVIPTKDTPESITLKAFFKHVNEGGKLTEEQAIRAFGRYEATGEQKLLQEGVLKEDQVKLLWAVAHGSAPVDELDRLLPGGSMPVSQEQLVQLQQIFTTEQLTPIVALIGMRMQRKQQQSESPS
jgi:hypothetical protein